MTAVSAVNPKLNFPSCPGGSVDVYVAGSTSRSNSWQDRNQTTLNTNPIILDARGECVAWLNSAIRYKFVVKNSAGVTIYTVDNVTGAQPGAATLTQFTTDTFSGTGAQTAFTLSVTPGNENATSVYVGGVYQQKNAYSVAGTTLTFAVAPASGTNNVEVVTAAVLDYTDVAADIAASVDAAADSADAAAESASDAADDAADADADRLDALTYSNQALQYRNDALAAVATGGISAFYDTYALALAAIGSIAASAYIEVLEDEIYGGRRTIRKKNGSALDFKAFADGPQSGNAGLGAMIRRPKGVLVQIGDSNTNGRPGWRTAYTADWLSTGGIFDGWTSYNLGHNGSTLAGWVSTGIPDALDPANAGYMPADYNGTDPDHELIRTINADPDVIIVRLGTNDLNSPANRTLNGPEAVLRANLATLVNFLLARTHASIWLVMPQPFGGEDFITGGVNITVWANDAETAEASRRLRVVYREWIGASDRVEVFDSHQALFGNSCDAIATNSQDPYLGAGNPLLVDSLHMSDLGYVRLAQMMSMQADSTYPRTPVFTIEPQTIPEDAVWSGTLYCHTAALGAVTTGLLDFDLSPSQVLGGHARAADSGSSQPHSLRQKRAIEDAGKTANLAVFRQILGVVDKTKLKAYNWTTGATYSLTNLTLSQIVTASALHYATLSITSGSTLSGLGAGPVTFYVTSDAAMPFARPRSITTSMTTTDRTFSAPYDTFPIRTGFATRKPHASTPVVTVYLQNQGDRRYVGAEGTFSAPGMVLGTFTWTSLGARATFVWDPTNFPTGGPRTIAPDWLEARVTTGSIATEFSAVGPDLVFTT